MPPIVTYHESYITNHEFNFCFAFSCYMLRVSCYMIFSAARSFAGLLRGLL